MRRVFPLLILAAAFSASAQDRPPKLEPLPEPPPPPVIRDGADEPRVRIAAPDNQVKETPAPGGGVTVTPPDAPPYTMIDGGPNEYGRRDVLDPGVRVPMWTIWTFD
jgi:hypothetical protein